MPHLWFIQWRSLFVEQARGVSVDQYVTKYCGDLLVHGRYKVGDCGEVRLAIGRERFELDIALAALLCGGGNQPLVVTEQHDFEQNRGVIR